MKRIEYKVVVEDGSKFWYLNGKLHREDGPACEYANGEKEWFLNGKLHREDGPAVEWANGDKFWCLDGKRHREDGPAAEYANGNKFWYLNGKEVTEAEVMKNQQTIDIDGKKFTLAQIKAALAKA
jgi:hypothetical protein